MRQSLLRTTRQFYRCRAQAGWSYAFSTSTKYASIDDSHRWSTPLAQQLAQAIAVSARSLLTEKIITDDERQTTGPVPVASFMRQCLTSDLGGYYTSQAASEGDQFGTKGDFVTSPEISQIFGELIGVWVVAEWISQGRKSDGVNLMELGPGRGTLMDDMLRTMRNFPEFIKVVNAVYLVEASPKLRKAQHALLCGDHPFERTDIGYESLAKHSNLKIVWTENLNPVPRAANDSPFIIAHEFFDALPIHVFQSLAPSGNAEATSEIETPTGRIGVPRTNRTASQHQWRELLVSPKPPHRLKSGEAEFELSIAKAATPNTMLLPETSSRYKALKDTTDATIEISPESQAIARDLAERIGGPNQHNESEKDNGIPREGRQVSSRHEPNPAQKTSSSGAALIMDYGPAATIPSNSLRGIRAHRRVSPFDSPGATDVSADVDFLALAEAAINGSPGVEVHGPLDQARFLTAMGIESRASQLVKQAVDKERGGSTSKNRAQLTELAKRIESGWRRLVDVSPQGMGRLYQVMAILPYHANAGNQSRRRPVGFGGDVKM